MISAETVHSRSAFRPLHVHAFGNGARSCVLLHGLGDGGLIWRHACRALPAGYRGLAVDLSGHGLSNWRSDGKYSTANHVADVWEILQSLSPRPIVLVGHSLGADVAARIAARNPERVRAIALIDYGPSPSSEGRDQMRADLSESVRSYRSVDDYVGWLSSKRPLSSSSLLRQWAEDALQEESDGFFRLRMDPAVVTASQGEDQEEDALRWQALRQIRCRCLIMRGAGSAVLQREVADRMLQQIPHSRLSTIRMAGHSVMLDSPDEFTQGLHSFLSELEDVNS